MKSKITAVDSNFVDVLTGEKAVKEVAKNVEVSVIKEIPVDYAKSQVIEAGKVLKEIFD